MLKPKMTAARVVSVRFMTILSKSSWEEGVQKLPQNSENKPRGLYFSKALFEGLIFGGAYGRTEICVVKSVGLACSGKEM